MKRKLSKVEQIPTQVGEMTTEERPQASPLTARRLLFDDQTPAVTGNNTPRKSQALYNNS